MTIRILLGSFLIFFGFKEGIALPPILFNDIESIFICKNVMLNNGMFHWLMTTEFNNMSMRRLNEMMIEVDELSEEYNEFTNNLKQKQDERWKYTTDRQRDTEFFSPMKFQLSTLINTIDFMHKERINFGSERGYMDALLHPKISFLIDTMYKLSDTLDQIHKLIFPSFSHITPQLLQLILINAERNLPENCDQYTSAQQFVYYIYITLIITEFKGLSTLIYISSVLHHITKSNDYITGIEFVDKKFTKRVTDYYNKIYKGMLPIPRIIHRCEMRFPKRGENFIELTHTNQIWLITSGRLLANEHLYRLNCFTKCEDVDPNPMGSVTNLLIKDCVTLALAKFLKSCPAKPETGRRYMWWVHKDKIYGHDEGCPTALQTGDGDPLYYDHCHICQCAVIPQKDILYNNSILRISVTPQVSDIENNMIVSGIKFVVYKNVLHLQIQQSKFILDKINDNSSEWKSLENFKSHSNESKIESEMLSKFAGQIYLDDVMLPPKYAVTGVNFRYRSQSPQGFYLQVQGTPIDLATGDLIVADAEWFIATPNFINTPDYERQRVEINVKNLDNPTRCKDYNYDRTSNNYIKFYHSSVTKDAGQSTVPFIDAQPVETYPPFPLGGIGLFYRNKEGCGGYIAPRIFTIDISQYN
ncbi:hypothetical protein PV327_005636 [Microctonus hyperodae]|uniref:Uncharacterized protein n=1 Tax=Microctonus hyperodae TaxID=165561 RepID=A0AA39G2K3_MICHY|nr:hypothetical protein PV327_005636 [Microctonus hyperodae]